MKNDFEMVVHKLDRAINHINIYPLGDLHIGSPTFSYKIWKKWKHMVLSDPHGYIVIVGDLADNGLKNSKTNSYEATLRPFEQKQWLATELKELRSRILGACRGNHEERAVALSDDCPLYDAMAKADLEELYRENMAFVKISLGEKRSDRQFTYVLTLGHGASRGKVEKFAYSLDGIDAIITGHTHRPSVHFPSKIIVDPRNDVIKQVTFIDLVVPSFQTYGGYALRGMYAPTSNDKFPILRLSGENKHIEVIWR